jgi:hypothetical protein
LTFPFSQSASIGIIFIFKRLLMYFDEAGFILSWEVKIRESVLFDKGLLLEQIVSLSANLNIVQ